MTADERIRKLLGDLELWERAYREVAAALPGERVRVWHAQSRAHSSRGEGPDLECGNAGGPLTIFRSVSQSQAAFRMVRRHAAFNAGQDGPPCFGSTASDQGLRAWSELQRRTSELLQYGEVLERVTGMPRPALKRLASSEGPADAVTGAPWVTGDAMFGIYGVGRPSDMSKGGPDLPSKESVKSFQGAIARLAGEHSRARSRLEHTMARRAAALAGHDKAVAAAQRDVEQVVVEMATALGPELTAGVLEMKLSEVRRLARTTRNGAQTCESPIDR